jgi:hypothetical protein
MKKTTTTQLEVYQLGYLSAESVKRINDNISEYNKLLAAKEVA